MSKTKLVKSEVEIIKEEILSILSTLIIGCESLDLEMAFSMFSNSPNFLMLGTGGSMCDYQTYLNDNISYLNDCSSFDLTTFKKEVRVIDRETAILAWAYKAVATLKTGEYDIVENAGASFVFNKTGDEWKVVYYHESSVPPVRLSQVE